MAARNRSGGGKLRGCGAFANGGVHLTVPSGNFGVGQALELLARMATAPRGTGFVPQSPAPTPAPPPPAPSNRTADGQPQMADGGLLGTLSKLVGGPGMMAAGGKNPVIQGMAQNPLYDALPFMPLSMIMKGAAGHANGGRMIAGPGDGRSDSVPGGPGAGGPAVRVSDGEYIVPADVVSALGRGSSGAGARQLDRMVTGTRQDWRKAMGAFGQPRKG